MKYAGLIQIILVSMLFACATSYHPKNIFGGYDDTKIESNTFQVSFDGNGFTSAQTVKNYLYYRAAEVTIANGFNYFIILETTDTTTQSVQVSHGAFSSGGNTFNLPGYNILIKCGKGVKPAMNNAFNAYEIKKNLEPLVKKSAGNSSAQANTTE